MALACEEGAMKHTDVDSDVIHSTAYDEVTRTLEIRFHETGTYRYYEVEPEVVEELLDAESKGQYFNEYRPRTLALASWKASEIEALVA
jgi:hypothetical protein